MAWAAVLALSTRPVTRSAYFRRFFLTYNSSLGDYDGIAIANESLFPNSLGKYITIAAIVGKGIYVYWRFQLAEAPSAPNCNTFRNSNRFH
jgi:hypothetical protein